MKSFKCLLACLCLGAALPAWGAFSIMGTRVIYHDREGEAAVHMQHVKGAGPVLLQAWLDDGSPEAKPGSQDLPFMVYPAVARVDAGATQVIRIGRIRDDVPDDREMLLYFNALEIPPAENDAALANTNALQFAMQARMKFFYRPRSLDSSPDQVADALRFQLAMRDGALRLRVHNPTPYHITMPNLGVYPAQADAAAQPLGKFQENGVAPMVPPFDVLEVPLTEFAPHTRASALAARPAADLQVRYTLINDQGGILPKSARLDHES